MSAPTVTALHVYPVKSCRGHSVARVECDRFGLVGDRRFLVVDERGRFLTQRDTPRLALIAAEVREGTIALRAPDVAPLSVPATRSKAEPVEVVVWRDRVRALDLGSAVASWLTIALDRPARLVAMAPDFSRPMGSKAAPTADEVAFTDAHPLLVISEASLADLNQRLDSPLPMNRFRPNIVVRGAAAYAEDAWRRIRIGTVVLRASGPCARCVTTTTDQETLARDKEPLRTLATYRRAPDGEVWFGQNYVHETKAGAIAVGDSVAIIE